MAAPDDTTLVYYFGTDGNPHNDTDPVGGAIATGTVIDEADANNLIYNPPILGSTEYYRGIGYRKNESAGSLDSAKIANRAGGILPASSAPFSVRSSSALDTGVLWLAYLSGSAWHTEEVTINGMSLVYGGANVDVSSDWLAVYEGVPEGDLTLQVNAVTVGVIYGSNGGNGNDQCSSLFQVALASAVDTNISASNRKTDPASGIGSFARATLWTGADNSIGVPGGPLAAGKRIGYCVKLKIPASLPKPPGNQVLVDVDLVGDPQP